MPDFNVRRAKRVQLRKPDVIFLKTSYEYSVMTGSGRRIPSAYLYFLARILGIGSARVCELREGDYFLMEGELWLIQNHKIPNIYSHYEGEAPVPPSREKLERLARHQCAGEKDPSERHLEEEPTEAAPPPPVKQDPPPPPVEEAVLVTEAVKEPPSEPEPASKPTEEELVPAVQPEGQNAPQADPAPLPDAQEPPPSVEDEEVARESSPEPETAKEAETVPLPETRMWSFRVEGQGVGDTFAMNHMLLEDRLGADKLPPEISVRLCEHHWPTHQNPRIERSVLRRLGVMERAESAGRERGFYWRVRPEARVWVQEEISLKPSLSVEEADEFLRSMGHEPIT